MSQKNDVYEGMTDEEIREFEDSYSDYLHEMDSEYTDEDFERMEQDVKNASIPERFPESVKLESLDMEVPIWELPRGQHLSDLFSVAYDNMYLDYQIQCQQAFDFREKAAQARRILDMYQVNSKEVLPAYVERELEPYWDVDTPIPDEAEANQTASDMEEDAVSELLDKRSQMMSDLYMLENWDWSKVPYTEQTAALKKSQPKLITTSQMSAELSRYYTDYAKKRVSDELHRMGEEHAPKKIELGEAKSFTQGFASGFAATFDFTKPVTEPVKNTDVELETGRKLSKNPYVHPSKDGKYLNRAGYDGWSYDEKAEDESSKNEEPVKRQGMSPQERADSILKEAERQKERQHSGFGFSE